MTDLVVDANVAVKWVLPEIHSDVALRLRDKRYRLLVPDFFFPEVGNIFWKRVRRGEITIENASSDLDAILGLPLIICPSFPVMRDALEIAVRVNQAIYDCVYLALAVSRDCQMVTADERFYNALSGDALVDRILWVEDIPDFS